jgi:hypothetical protein
VALGLGLAKAAGGGLNIYCCAMVPQLAINLNSLLGCCMYERGGKLRRVFEHIIVREQSRCYEY